MQPLYMPRFVFLLVFSATTHEGQKSYVAGAFHRAGQIALVFGAGAGLAAWADFALFGYIAFEHVDSFVIDVQIFVRAEGAYLWAREITTFATLTAFFCASISITIVVHNFLSTCGMQPPQSKLKWEFIIVGGRGFGCFGGIYRVADDGARFAAVTQHHHFVGYYFHAAVFVAFFVFPTAGL